MSKVAICNQGLSWIGGNLITSFGDGSTEADLCSTNYEALRDSVLEDREWTFAQQWFRLTPTTSTPTNQARWSYQFLLDPQILKVNEVVNENDNPLTFSKERRYLYSNSAVLVIRATIKIVDTTEFSSGFIQALAARIAADLAIPLTESRSLQKDMYALYGQKLVDGITVDSMQGTARRARSRWPFVVR